MSNLHYYYRNIDPEFIEKLPSAKKNKARISLLKRFLLKTYFRNYEGESDMKNIFLLKNSNKLFKISVGFSLFFNVICYKFLFTGVYEYGRFYFDPKIFPFAVKILFTSFLSYKLLNNLWSHYIYIPELYEIAIEDFNRNLELKENVNKDKLSNNTKTSS